MADPLAPLLRLVEVGALACAAWLGVLVLLATGARLPGALGASARRLARVLAPVALHATLGVAVSAVGLTGSAAAAERPAPPSLSLEWPGTAAAAGPTPTAGATAAPTRTPPVADPSTSASPSAASPSVAPLPSRTDAVAAPSPTTPTAGPATAVEPAARVVVRAGDSLWALAARDLGAGATPVRVALAWPRWWAVNRDVIGDDPDLIHPGTVLDRPDRPQESS